jgi:hypothetical protein
MSKAVHWSDRLIMQNDMSKDEDQNVNFGESFLVMKCSQRRFPNDN